MHWQFRNLGTAKDPVDVLIEGLRKLEYRGYDSAGIAVVDSDSKLHIRRAPGRLRDLEKVLGETRRYAEINGSPQKLIVSSAYDGLEIAI